MDTSFVLRIERILSIFDVFIVLSEVDQADESLEAARTLLDKGVIRPSLNRGYNTII